MCDGAARRHQVARSTRPRQRSARRRTGYRDGQVPSVAATLRIMRTPNASQRSETTLVVLGVILLVAGGAMAVVGFTDTGAFLGVMGSIIAVGGVAALIVAIGRTPVR